MNILFICRANVGRSQMAEALFNKLSGKHHSESAGTSVDNNRGKTGQTLEEFARDIDHKADNVIKVLKEEGIDVSKNRRTQLQESMLEKFDKVFVLCDEKECPDYLLNNDKVKFCFVTDAKGTDYDFHIKIREEIKKLVKSILEDLE